MSADQSGGTVPGMELLFMKRFFRVVMLLHSLGRVLVMLLLLSCLLTLHNHQTGMMRCKPEFRTRKYSSNQANGLPKGCGIKAPLTA